MNLKTISLDKLNPAPYNPRTITDDEFNGLVESLKTFGQQENLIVNKDMTIISPSKLMMCYNSIMASKEYYYKLWRENPERRAKNRTYKHISRFGFDVDEYREAGNCAMCGITNSECKEKYNKVLSIDHINNNGRSKYAKSLDNAKTNLQLLCQSCHTIKTNKVDSKHKYQDPERMKKHWNTRYNKYPRLRIKYNNEYVTVKEYADIKGFSKGYIYYLVKNNKISCIRATK